MHNPTLSSTPQPPFSFYDVHANSHSWLQNVPVFSSDLLYTHKWAPGTTHPNLSKTGCYLTLLYTVCGCCYSDFIEIRSHFIRFSKVCIHTSDLTSATQSNCLSTFSVLYAYIIWNDLFRLRCPSSTTCSKVAFWLRIYWKLIVCNLSTYLLISAGTAPRVRAVLVGSYWLKVGCSVTFEEPLKCVCCSPDFDKNLALSQGVSINQIFSIHEPFGPLHFKLASHRCQHQQVVRPMDPSDSCSCLFFFFSC